MDLCDVVVVVAETLEECLLEPRRVTPCPVELHPGRTDRSETITHHRLPHRSCSSDRVLRAEVVERDDPVRTQQTTRHQRVLADVLVQMRRVDVDEPQRARRDMGLELLAQPTHDRRQLGVERPIVLLERFLSKFGVEVPYAWRDARFGPGCVEEIAHREVLRRLAEATDVDGALPQIDPDLGKAPGRIALGLRAENPLEQRSIHQREPAGDILEITSSAHYRSQASGRPMDRFRARPAGERAAIQEASIVRSAGSRSELTIERWDWLGEGARGDVRGNPIAVLRRSAEVVVAAVLTIVTLPVVLIGAVLSFAHYRAWPFFVHERVGLDGETFRFYKIRTLPPETASYADKYALRGAGIPPLMELARRLHLDEFPQLIHVLTGKMSLVGPRPEMPTLHGQLPESFARLRTSVRPGLTCLWQISPHSAGLISERSEYDRLYLDYRNLRLDVWILFRTLLKMTVGRTIHLHEVPFWAIERRRLTIDLTREASPRESHRVV